MIGLVRGWLLQVRLNGGTNIAAAVAKAGSLLKADEETHSSKTRRVLVLLTGETGPCGVRDGIPPAAGGYSLDFSR